MWQNQQPAEAAAAAARLNPLAWGYLFSLAGLLGAWRGEHRIYRSAESRTTVNARGLQHDNTNSAELGNNLKNSSDNPKLKKIKCVKIA